MPASGIKLLDSNVWLAIAVDGHTHHRDAVGWFDSQENLTCAFCRVTQMALLRHLTNSHIMGVNTMSQFDAWQSYDEFLKDGRVFFLNEPANLDETFRKLTHANTPSHAQWTDSYLAAFAIAADAGIATFDKGFSKFPGLNFQALT